MIPARAMIAIMQGMLLSEGDKAWRVRLATLAGSVAITKEDGGDGFIWSTGRKEARVSADATPAQIQWALCELEGEAWQS